MVQYAFHLNGGICTGCKTCQVACKETYKLPVNNLYRKVYNYQGGSWKPTEAGHYVPEGVFGYFVSMACNHCVDPACVANCPTGAMHKREEDGIVESDHSVCIGCGTCAQSCPYGAPVVADDLGYAMKCDFCRPRVERGEEPLCVCSCPAEARVFGEISDPNSEISKLIAELFAEPLLPEEGTEPSVRYC